MAKKLYEYRNRDCFWDLESLENLFTVGFYYPKLNYMILSYIDDDNMINPNDLDQIKKIARERHKDFNGEIYLENLAFVGSAEKGIPGIQTFAKRLGVTKKGLDEYGGDNDQIINGHSSKRSVYMKGSKDENGNDTYKLDIPGIYYPVKDTDPEYDPDEHGFFFGYNTTQYDLTMIAHFLTNLNTVLLPNQDPYRKVIFKDSSGEGELLTAKMIRAFNDTLFEGENRKNMPKQLTYDYYSGDNIAYQQPSYQTESWLLRKAYLYTNRFIDVAALNEKMYRVALKRLLGMLGHTIMEFDGLSGGNALTDKNKVNDLIIYQFSDVINLRWLFEHSVYQNNFNIKRKLLSDYPETIYQRQRSNQDAIREAFVNGEDPSTAIPYAADINYRRVDRYRLTIDSTSAKFVEKIIAPYNKMTDKKVVDFTYPAPDVAKQLSLELGYEVKPTDILEDTKTWFEENVAQPGTQAHDEFMDVYNFYDGIRGRNFNESEKYNEDYRNHPELTYDPKRDSDYVKDLIENTNLDITPKSSDYVKDLMRKYNTNLFYFDKNGEKTTCMVTFSIGGIHGAEINMPLYMHDLREWDKKETELNFIKNQFNSDPLVAINGDVYVTDSNGKQRRMREFMKSGSTRKNAAWRENPRPSLFKPKDGVLKINNKYNYVSVGPSQHEDFTSYYPLLLTRLAVFINDERGEGVDPYYGVFEQRFEKKKESRDKSLSEEVRALADLVQDAMKLLLNSATGAADAGYDNNIRMNNAIISMRIIGQLFAWRIGQAQTLAGARVPSTNTDGLYTMDLDEETNARILNDVAKDMYIGIEPEPLTRFVTKDSNNRLEIEDGKISSAKGGALNSWGGPQPTQSLDHPSAVDRALAYYLRDHDDPANSPFDYDLARRSFSEIVVEYAHNPVEILRHFQWVLSSSMGTNQYVFLQEKNTANDTIIQNRSIQQYNRAFLIKNEGQIITTPLMAVKRKLNPNTAKKRHASGEMVQQHDPIAYKIMTENGFNWVTHTEKRDEAKIQKVKNMPEDQNVYIYNDDLYSLSTQEIQTILNKLDIEAYITLLQNTFEKSWSNVSKNKDVA